MRETQERITYAVSWQLLFGVARDTGSTEADYIKITGEFEELWKPIKPRLEAILRKRKVRDVDDITQETAARALNQGDEYFADTSHLLGWCVVTAINYATDIRRRDSREWVGEPVEVIDWTDVADRVAAGIALDLAVAEVARLTAAERDVLFERVRGSNRREAVKFHVQRKRIRIRVSEATGGLAAAIARVRIRWPQLAAKVSGPSAVAAVAVAVGLANLSQLPYVNHPTHSPLLPESESAGAARLADAHWLAQPGERPGNSSTPGAALAPPRQRSPYLRVPIGRDSDGNRQEATIAPARPDQRGQLVCGEFVGSARTCVKSPIESASDTAVQTFLWLSGEGPPPTVAAWPPLYTEPRPNP